MYPAEDIYNPPPIPACDGHVWDDITITFGYLGSTPVIIVCRACGICGAPDDE
jgi:hypothetical protein